MASFSKSHESPIMHTDINLYLGNRRYQLSAQFPSCDSSDSGRRYWDTNLGSSWEYTTLGIVWFSCKARYCAQAGRGRFSFREVKRGCLLDSDLYFRTGLLLYSGDCFLGPGFYDCLSTRANFLCTESAEVTSRTHGKTNDLNRFQVSSERLSDRLTEHT